jgi:selenocysteine lyase/cysteine desulfurase
MNRRELMKYAVGAGALAPVLSHSLTSAKKGASSPVFDPNDWGSLRQQFSLTYDYIHLATFLLASHPKPVADAIAHHRLELDKNPADYWHHQYETIDAKIAHSAADYMGGGWQQIALTDSTTMGLAMVYSGLKLAPGDEVLSTTHDHYSTELSLKYRADRTGATVRHIPLYSDAATASVDEVVGRLGSQIKDNTKVVAVTWVHSSTGVKLPIRAMASAIEEINNKRAAKDKIVFCVDGVHGFGIEDVDIDKLGCDFFVAGTHKWIFGPRGTGVIWGKQQAWANEHPIIPSFSRNYGVWLGQVDLADVSPGELMTPGGFHSFEHRWALPEAFAFHLQIGKARVQQRIHELNTRTKLGLQEMSHVKLHTPMATELSSGLVCFEVDGVKADEVVRRLHNKGIIMSATPYKVSYARFAPSLINNEIEIDRALAQVRALA